MNFASPLWLALLAPLAALVVYLLWGRRPLAPVPFLDLWTGPVKGPRPTRRFAAPPLALALAILSMLLAAFGAARPALWDSRRGPPVTVVVDRGATMSAGNAWVEPARAVHAALAQEGGTIPIDLVVVPGGVGRRTEKAQWLAEVEALAPTAVDSAVALHATVARRLAESDGPVLVLTDRPLSLPDERVVTVAPSRSVNNAGVTLLAARESPTPQVMVRVGGGATGQSAPARGELRVSSAGREVVRPVETGTAGGSRDYFIDLEAVGDVVKAELVVEDDFPGDDAAWLVREGSPPRLEPRGALPAELLRIVEVYAASRPPAAESPRVILTRDNVVLPPASVGVVLADARDVAAAGDAQVRPHPVTRDTRWTFREPVRLAAAPSGGTANPWTPVVTLGGRTAVAVCEAPARQVWVGIESEEWPRTPEYVVFWANVFDWLGGEGVSFAAHPARRLVGAWEPVEWAGQRSGRGPKSVADWSEDVGFWPGCYRRTEDGVLRAVNAGGVQFPTPPADAWRPRLERALERRASGRARPAAPGVLLTSAACAALAAAVWKRSPRRNLAAT